MKKAGIFLSVLFLLFFCSVGTDAQINILSQEDLSAINIDDYSDNEINAMYSKAIENGLTEPQLLKIVAQKGLPAREIEKLRARIRYMDRSGPSGEKRSTVPAADTTAFPQRYDTAESRIPMERFKNDETIFGSELFTNNSLVFEPNLRIPAPVGYVLGPDDEIVVSVYGYSEKKYNLKVNELGEVYIPNVGPLLVSGLTLEEASGKIKSKLASTIYRAINTGQTKVQVSLGKIRSIRVTVIGQAKKPGSFTVSSLTTLYNILYLCGGPTPMGSYRSIQVVRGNSVKRAADLYDFLVEGNQKDNIILQEGDVVRIPYYKNRVTIKGRVKREGKFEMLDGETFRDLLNFCGGFTDNAYRGAVTVIRISDNERKIVDLSSSDYNSFQANGSDEYIVGKLQEEFENRIVVSGSVMRPGPYQLTQGLTVKGLIEKSGGLTVDAYKKRATIFRYFENKMPTTLSIDLDSAMDNQRGVLLHKDDSLSIHSIFEFNSSNYISVEGNVRQPGVVPWRENFTLRDLLLSVGGLTESGDSTNIEISRRIKNASVDKANHNESKVFNVDLSGKSELPQDIELQPYDMVIVKTLPGYTKQRSVLVLGEIKSPGRYGLENSGERITDVLERAGGFKASADSTSITIRRSIKSSLTIQEREKLFQRILNVNSDSLNQNPRLRDELYKTYDLISVDLAEAFKNPSSSENLTLEEGDVLTVERSSNLVKISGEVYFPTIVPYKENKTLKYYVEQAGSFTPFARKTGALVINPDGKAASVKHFLWFKSYPSVSPRSEIYVPQKLKSNRARFGPGEWALIVSALGIVANVFITATK